MTSQQDLGAQFLALHQADDAFIIPNPWDAGTARLLQGMGFKALATTSGGFALTLAKADGMPTLEEKLSHCQALVQAVDVPINADFEDGFADDAATVAANMKRLIETGVAGGSIEDFSRSGQRIFELDHAVERLAAALEVTQAQPFPFLLTARAENLIRGVQDLDDTIRRLQAYEKAGADVLYAPGLQTLDQVAQVSREVSKPLNVLGVLIPGATLAELQDAGAQRVSIGGALTYAAMKPVLDFGQAMAERGDFSWVREMASGKALAELLNG